MPTGVQDQGFQEFPEFPFRRGLAQSTDLFGREFTHNLRHKL
jgi:hypothetical protein